MCISITTKIKINKNVNVHVFYIDGGWALKIISTGESKESQFNTNTITPKPMSYD